MLVYKRVAAAIIVTGLTSAFVLAMISTISSHISGDFDSQPISETALSYFGPVWLLGSCAATFWATLLACIVELPKLKVLIVIGSNRFWPSILISVVGAEWLLLSWTTAATIFAPSLNIQYEVIESLSIVVASFAIGGACSGVTWWKLVRRHVGRGTVNSELLARI